MDETVLFKNQEKVQKPSQVELKNSIQPQSGGNKPLPPPPKFFGPGSFFSGSLLRGIIGGIIIILILIFLFSFLGPLFAPKSNQTVNLIYWGLWEDERTMQPIIADFERANPRIKVSYIKQDNKQYLQRLITRSKQGNGPDIFRFHNTWVPILSGILVALPKDVISPADFKKNYYPIVQADLTKNGAIYGIPFEMDTLSLFVNTDIFKSAGYSVPKTWDEFVKTAKSITVPDPQNPGKIKTAGAALGAFDNITHAPDIISMLFAQNGVNLRNPLQTESNAVDALQFYTAFTKDADNVWDTTMPISLTSFANGNLAMYFGYSWDIFAIKSLNPSLNFTVNSVPSLSDRRTTIASYWVEGVSAKSKHEKEALLFLHYLAQKETAQKLYTEEAKTRLFGEPYAEVNLADTVKNNPLVYPFLSQAQNAVSSPFSSDTYDDALNSQLNAYLGNAVRSILSGVSVNSAVETLGKGVQQISQQYGQ